MSGTGGPSRRLRMGRESPGPHSILLPCGEVCAAVLLPAGFVVVGTLRAFLAVADGLQFIGRNSQLDQEVLGGSGALVAQSQVVLGRAALVAMALDGDAGIGEAGEDGLQRVGVLGKRGAGILADIVLVVVEEGVHDAAREHLLQGGLGRDGRRRWRRRLGYIDGSGGGFGAAGAGGRQRIGGGSAGEYAAVSGGLHGADAVIDGNTGGVGDIPAQGRRLSAFDRRRLGGKRGDTGRRWRGRRRCRCGSWRRWGRRWRRFLLATRREHRQSQANADGADS